jgi:hypothetical protein
MPMTGTCEESKERQRPLHPHVMQAVHDGTRAGKQIFHQPLGVRDEETSKEAGSGGSVGETREG